MTLVSRYAPSPTGSLHIGGARTALFSWALARSRGGRFLLRFEDTDRERSSRESEREILEALEWLGLDWDPVPGFDGIPRQSERVERYGELVAGLLENGAAYRCTCTSEDLDRMRERARAARASRQGYDGTCRQKEIGADSAAPFCIRLRVEADHPTHFTDLIAGASGQSASEIEDFVIARTDGTPVYHFAVVVDDHDMGVTHVLRGREHLLSTPRQLLLYAALGFSPPDFAHVPLLVNAKGKKLSKREGEVSVQAYRERGFTPEAVLNYLVRLGWSHGDLEILDRQRFVELFSLDSVGQSPSQVQEDKLIALQQHWLKELPPEQLHSYVQPFLEAEAEQPVTIDAPLEQLLELLRPRSETLADMARRARFALREHVELDEKAARKYLKPAARPILQDLRERLAALERWEEAELERVLESVRAAHDLKMGQLAQPTRVAVTGRAASPGIYETVAIVGRDRTLARLDGALAWIDAPSH